MLVQKKPEGGGAELKVLYNLKRGESGGPVGGLWPN